MSKTITKTITIITAMLFMSTSQAGYLSCFSSTDVMECLIQTQTQKSETTIETTTVIDRGGSPSSKTTSSEETTTVIDRGGSPSNKSTSSDQTVSVIDRGGVQ